MKDKGDFDNSETKEFLSVIGFLSAGWVLADFLLKKMPPTICKGGSLYEHNSGVMKLRPNGFLQTAWRYVCQVPLQHLAPTTTELLACRRKNAVPSPVLGGCVRTCVGTMGTVSKSACVLHALSLSHVVASHSRLRGGSKQRRAHAVH